MIETLLIAILATKKLYQSCPLDKKRSVIDSIEKRNAVDPINRKNEVLNELDGKFLSCSECGGAGECGSKESGNTTAPKTGKKPSNGPGKFCSGTNLNKIIFINGINNTPKENCVSAKKLATTMCSEVISFYNTTDGIMGDLSESVKNIKNNSNESTEPARALQQYLKEHQGENLTIAAHSQGGLIARQALLGRQADLVGEGKTIEDTKNELSKIKVISCGTAENGWPDGPKYTQYTNHLDPIPKAIGETDEIYETYGPPIGMASESDIERHKFLDWAPSSISGFVGHSMDDIYIPKIAEDQKNKETVNNCITCPKKSYITNAN